jgi:hypothetical protein
VHLLRPDHADAARGHEVDTAAVEGADRAGLDRADREGRLDVARIVQPRLHRPRDLDAAEIGQRQDAER